MVALGALYVVALENPGDFPVAPSRQIASDTQGTRSSPA